MINDDESERDRRTGDNKEKANINGSVDAFRNERIQLLDVCVCVGGLSMWERCCRIATVTEAIDHQQCLPDDSK